MTTLDQTSASSKSFSPHFNKIGIGNALTSDDGTKIAYLSFGNGPAILVVPGALSVAADYTALAEALAKYYFSVHVLERRGRGQSGPQGQAYSLAKECDDVRALQQKTGATFMVGHSYGGLVALEAARNNPAFSKIAVYEPGVSINGSISMDWMPAYKTRLANRQYADAFVEFVRGTGPARARQTPRWLMKLLLPFILNPAERQQRLTLLPQNLREHEEVARLDNSYPHYCEIIADTLLMHGGKDSIEWVSPSLQRLAEVLPQSKTVKFPRLNHFGIDKGAPQEVAQVIGDYFLFNFSSANRPG